MNMCVEFSREDSRADRSLIDQYVARVTAGTEMSGWVLENGQVAKRSVSCVVEPKHGDKVLVINDEGTSVILAILSRPDLSGVTLSAGQRECLQLQGRSITLTADNQIDLNAVAGIKLFAPLGSLQVVVNSLFQTVRASLISIAQSLISKTGHCQIEAEETLVMRSKIQTIRAEGDLHMDANRINMG